MWNLFAPKTNSVDENPEDEDKEDVEAEEIEEMRLKLEALRAADYREQQRLCVAREKARLAAASAKSSGSPAPNQETEHFELVDDDAYPEGTMDDAELGNMYDALSSFKQPTEATASSSSSAAPQQQQPEMRLAGTQRALLALKAQVQQLARQSVEQDLRERSDSCSPGNLLESLEAVQAELDILSKEQDSCPQQLNQQQQPQEPPEQAPDPLEGFSREHVMQLAQITGELTDALDDMRAKEECARQELRIVTQQLTEEQAHHRSCQQALEVAKAELEVARVRQEQSSHGFVQLATALKEKDTLLEQEIAKCHDLQDRLTRLELEDAMGQALTKKNMKYQFKHIEC